MVAVFERSLPIVNVILGLRERREAWRVSLIRWSSVALSYVKPNTCSNARHADNGNQIWETVASMNESMGIGRRETADWLVDPDEILELAVIACIPTTRFREMSSAKLQDTLFGMKRNES